MFITLLKNKRKLVGRLVVLSALVGSQLTMLSQINWAPAGPVTTPSRIRSVIVDNQDQSGNKLYAGSVVGGLFQSTDAGLNWIPLTDQATVKNISCLAQSPSGVLYVGTGENYARPNQVAKLTQGTGLYTYSNGNLSLVAGTSVFGNINEIKVNPANAQRIYVASATGLYVSTDGGTTWALGTSTTAVGQAFDVELASNGYAYASVGDISGGSQVWESTNGDPGTFVTNRTPTVALVTPTYGRIEIAIPVGNPNKIYFSCAGPFLNNNSTLQGLFVVENTAVSWAPTLILEGSAQLDPLRGGGASWGDYSHELVVDPVNHNRIFIGGYSLYIWVKTGTTPGIGNWIKLGSDAAINTFLYLPKNVHQIVFKPSDANTIYVATDGSIYKTSDKGTSFIGAFKGLNATAFNNIAVMAKPNIVTYVPTTTASVGNGGTPINGQTGFVASGVSSGMTYYSGNYPLVVGEEDYQTGEFNNVAISNILPKASVVTRADGTIWRTSDYTTQDFTQFSVRSSVGAATSNNFINTAFNVAGTPFSVFENRGQLAGTTPSVNTPCDSAIFYNDIVGLKFALTTPTNAPNANAPIIFQNVRPQAAALYDSISIVTSNANTCGIVPSQTIQIVPVYTGTNSNPTFTVLTGASSSSANANNFITMDYNATTLKDNLSFQFLTAAGPSTASCPSGTSTINSKIDLNIRIYYKYPAGSKVTLVNTDISTKALSVTSGTFGYKSQRAGFDNSPVKVALPLSTRFAFATNRGVFVSRNMFDFSDAPSTHMISANDSLRIDGPGGVPSTSTAISPANARVKFLQWAPSGRELYMVRAATSGTTTISYIYRISHLIDMYDSTFANYSGRFNTAATIYKVYNAANPGASTLKLNPKSPFRTTLIGRIDSVVTSVSIFGANGLILTVASTTNTTTDARVYISNTALNTANTATNMANFINKTGTLSNTIKLYASLSEMNDNAKVLLGTSNGVWMTNDINAPTPTWSNANNNQIPNIEVYDIKQQTLPHWQSHLSGVIFATTNGRGVWRTNAYYTQSFIGINEIVATTKVGSLKMYPNPSSGTLSFDCKTITGEHLKMEVVDIMGRVVLTEDLGKVTTDAITYTTDLSALNNGVYLVSVKGNQGTNHIGKLILSK
jgi:hypothetical protein